MNNEETTSVITINISSLSSQHHLPRRCFQILMAPHVFPQKQHIPTDSFYQQSHFYHLNNCALADGSNKLHSAFQDLSDQLFYYNATRRSILILASLHLHVQLDVAVLIKKPSMTKDVWLCSTDSDISTVVYVYECVSFSPLLSLVAVTLSATIAKMSKNDDDYPLLKIMI